MNSIEQKISDFHKSVKDGINNSIIDTERDFELFKSVTLNLLQSCDSKESFEKSWSGDLQKQFPNGVWRKINGASVFINHGRVVAGLDKFNGMIDDFFAKKSEKKEGENKTSDSSLQRVKHAQFGEGNVLEQDDKTITIQFDTEGKKKLLKQFVKLETLSGEKIESNIEQSKEDKKEIKLIPKDNKKELSLEEQIDELKAGRTLTEIKEKDKKSYYKIQSLKDKIAQIKLEETGNVVTKEHLTEYKPLIIWALKNKADYKGYMNLKDSMQLVLDEVSNKKHYFKNEKDLKSTLVAISVLKGLENAEKNLRYAKGYSQTESTTGRRDLEDFTTHRLSALMNI
jgi:hypothetical protein